MYSIYKSEKLTKTQEEIVKMIIFSIKNNQLITQDNIEIAYMNCVSNVCVGHFLEKEKKSNSKHYRNYIVPYLKTWFSRNLGNILAKNHIKIVSKDQQEKLRKSKGFYSKVLVKQIFPNITFDLNEKRSNTVKVQTV